MKLFEFKSHRLYCSQSARKFSFLHISLHATMRNAIKIKNCCFFQTPETPNLQNIKLASTASLNDCQLRYVYRYRYVIVIDFDEVVVPRFHQNYSQMICDIRKKYNLQDPAYQYQFVNTYFFMDYQPDTSQPSYLRTLRQRHCTAPSPYGVGQYSDAHSDRSIVKI